MRVEQYVCRAHVVVDEPAFVNAVQRVCELDSKVDYIGLRERSSAQPSSERFTGDEFHHEVRALVGPPNLHHGRKRGMANSRKGRRLTQEALSNRFQSIVVA